MLYDVIMSHARDKENFTSRTLQLLSISFHSFYCCSKTFQNLNKDLNLFLL